MRHSQLQVLLWWLAAASLLTACQKAPEDARAWARRVGARELPLKARGQVGGKLWVDPKLSPEIDNFAGVYLPTLGEHMRVKQLQDMINQDQQVPLEVFLFADAQQMRAAGGKDLPGMGGFMPASKRILVAFGPEQLRDTGQRRALWRGVVGAHLQSILKGDHPWLRIGAAEALADGAIDPKEDQPHKNPAYRVGDWRRGVPHAPDWLDLISEEGRAGLPAFDAILRADAAQFLAMGKAGRQMATVVVHLLMQLGQFGRIYWQYQGQEQRGPDGMQAIITKNNPRWRDHLADPVGMLFRLRPDFRAYVELWRDRAKPASRAGIEKLCAEHPKVGSYWWLLAQHHLAQQPQTEASREAALEALGQSIACQRHRHLGPALAALCDLHRVAGDDKGLAAAHRRQFESLTWLRTPQYYLDQLRILRASDAKPEIIQRTIAAGLKLPAAGFEKQMAELRAAQGK